MHRIIVILYFLLFVLFSFPEVNAQEGKTDRKYLIDSLNKLVPSIAFAEPDSAIALSLKVIQLSQSMNDRVAESLSRYNLGLSYYAADRDSAALDSFKDAIAVAENHPDSLVLAKANHGSGLASFRQGDYGSAIVFHRMAMDIADKIGNHSYAANASNSIGVNYLYSGNYPKAVEQYNRALKFAEKVNDSANLGRIYTNLGIVFRRMNEPVKALSFNQTALRYVPGNANPARANILANIANIYDDTGRSDSALLFYSQAIGIYKRSKDRRGVARNMLNIGIVYKGLRNAEKAFHFVQDALTLSYEMEDRNSISIGLAEKALLLSRISQSLFDSLGLHKSRHEAAIELLQQSLAIGKEIGSVDNQKAAFEYLYELYSEHKDDKNALNAYKQFILLRDSLVNSDNREHIALLSMKYQQERREDSLHLQYGKQQLEASAKLERQSLLKKIALGALILVMIGAATGFVFYKKRKDLRMRLVEAQNKTEKTALEMQVLRSRMNPHFIFNSLNSINDFVSKNEKKLAEEYLTRFASLMRMVLENAASNAIPLEDELAALQLYVSLEQKRLDKSFSFTVEVDENIDPERVMIPPLLFQPFVENSIWHGIAPLKDRDGKIELIIAASEGLLHCLIRDNGVGIQHSHTVHGRRSFGMEATGKRIVLLKDGSEVLVPVKLTELEQGVSVMINLPLDQI
jgi:tetratricopeptide (TPR) repeat protein/two-component sensor histidine kinase